jgi:hydrogenase-4 component B
LDIRNEDTRKHGCECQIHRTGAIAAEALMVVYILFGVAALVATAPIAVAVHASPRANTAIYGGSLIVTSLLCVIALKSLFEQPNISSLMLPFGLPWLGAHFRIDALSAFFLVVVNLGGAAASLFALGYGSHEKSPERVLPFYPFYLAAMNLVVLAGDAFSFLVSWEFMSLTSWALVIAHHREPDNMRAGYVYLLMASFGTLALLLAFGLLAGADGNYTFDAIRATHPSAGLAALVLILVLVGAGSKAGVVPLHAWLPLAHPAAPSHVSALMSGVMTKVAVYGFVRIVFDLIGAPAWWWSMLVLVVGGITAVMGVLYALMQHDLKRLLAYHTVENIGIIFIGLGLALAFKAHAMPMAAALALAAGLFHVFNHSVFKSLLFFGAGAVLNSTGERDMEHLGGLIHRMPQTAFAFLVGCVAISALPPLNGFVSEWLTFQAILLSPQLPSWGLKFLVPAVGALLALSAALAAACFVKAFGISFLGRARMPAAASAQETDGKSLAAVYVLAALCLIAGIVPGFFIDALGPVTDSLIGVSMPHQAGMDWLSIVPIAESRSSYNGLLVFIFVAMSGSLAAFAIHRLASDQLRRGPAWDCGYPDPSVAAQYTASSFAQPIRRVYGTSVFRAREIGEMPPPGATAPARLTVELRDRIWDIGYAPVAAGVTYTAAKLNSLQFLTIRQYLSLVFAALVILLLVLAIWQ